MTADEFYLGRRLSYEGHLCTVRYHGPVQGTTGTWLGVEWDNTTRGKHNGYHKGAQVFKCRSRSDICASFIRPNRKPDPERTVLEAIRYKYDATDIINETIVISGKVAEEVGFDKIARAQAQLKELRVVLIDQLLVSGLARSGQDLNEARTELRETCPSIVELDLGYNLIDKWSTVTDICAALPNLTTLRVGGLRFRDEFDFTAPLRHVRELHLEECLLSSSDLSKLLCCPSELPELETLYLSGNELETICAQKNDTALAPYSKALVLENNLFTNLDCLQTISKAFPAANSLSLQGNNIKSINSPTSFQPILHITSLNLSENEIASWAFIDSLSKLLPNLKSLRITNNPVYSLAEEEAQDPRASDKLFYLTLARIPSLTSLNHSLITAKDRMEGEIYYLSMAEKDINELLASKDESHQQSDLLDRARKLHPQYHRLTQKYDRDSVLNPENTFAQNNKAVAILHKYPAGSLGARLVKATFYLPNNSNTELQLSLPSTLATSQVMALLLRQPVFADILRPLQFFMIYESDELDPVDTTTESTTRSAVYGKNLTAEEKQNLWNEWGDWDADAIVDQALNGDSERESIANADTGRWIEDNEVLVKDGRQWKRRTVSIPPSLKRAWGDFLDGSQDVRIRLELRG